MEVREVQLEEVLKEVRKVKVREVQLEEVWKAV